MALPKSLMSARLTNATSADLIDNGIGDLEKALADIFGIPIDTMINVGSTINLPLQLRMQDSHAISWGNGNNAITGVVSGAGYVSIKAGGNADVVRFYSGGIVFHGDVDTWIGPVFSGTPLVAEADRIGFVTGNIRRVTIDNTGLNVLSGNIEIVTNGAIWWTGDDDTFISHPAANTIRFTAGGADVLTLDAAGMIISQNSLVLGGDTDTFLGHPGADLLTLVCGNVEVARAHPTLGWLLGAAMALRWGADTNTSIEKDGEDVIAVWTGGVQRARFHNTGLSITGDVGVSGNFFGSGQIQVGAASPIFWAGDLDTTIWHPAADTLAMTLGNQVRLRYRNDAAELLRFEESTLSHNFTAATGTNVLAKIGVISPSNPGDGGAVLAGYSSTNIGVMLSGACVQPATTDTGASVGIVNLDAYAQSANNVAPPGATANVLTVRAGGSTRVLVKGNGEVHASDTSWAELLDEYDDAQLVRAFSLAHGPDLRGLIQSRWDEFITYNRETLIEAGIIARDGEDGSKGLINLTRLWQLYAGAIWQLYGMIQEEREWRRSRSGKFFRMKRWLPRKSSRLLERYCFRMRSLLPALSGWRRSSRLR